MSNDVWEIRVAWVGVKSKFSAFAISKKIIGRYNIVKDAIGFLIRFRFARTNVQKMRKKNNIFVDWGKSCNLLYLD